MSIHDITYNSLLTKLLTKALLNGPRSDRTGTGTYSIFGEQLSFDLQKGFPLLTTKKVHMKSVIHELLWFLRGDTYTDYLKENNVTIWDEWTTEDGYLGPIYGAQWRNWKGVFGSYDQIATLMDNLKNNPYSRRHIVSAWNVEFLPDPAKTPQENALFDLMALPPCHTLWQVYIDEQTKAVSLKLYQRSADYFLGVPFNIASYALLTHMIAHLLERPVGELIISFGDCHLYSNHLNQAHEQLKRNTSIHAPQISIKRKPENLWDFQYEDFEITGYNPLPAISAPISI